MKICTLSFQVNCISQVFIKAFHSISVFIFMIVLNCVFNKAIAQTPYQPFFNDSTLLYKAQNLDFTGWNDQYQKSYYKAASFDSVLNTNGLTFYYPFKTARDTSDQPQGGSCIDLTGNSWMGKYFYHDTQMHYQFINFENDTIYLHTQENIGHEWVFYSYPNGDYLKATITAVAISNLNGISDSVKTIQLNLYDANGNAGSNSWTQKEILLSQHNGLIKCPVFNEFPTDTNMVTRQFNLNIATTSEIYDFNVGDKFYYQSYKTNNWPPTEATDYTHLELMSKTTDTINQVITCTYNSTYYNYISNFPNPPYLDSIIYATITYNFPLNVSMGIPEKTAFDSTFGILHNLMQDFNDNGLTLIDPVYVKNTRIYIPGGNNCYSTTITTLPIISKYTKSLGRIYYEEYWNGTGGSAPVSYINKLIGYQKNGINYGNYLAIENLNKNADPVFQINGNPSENLSIEWLAKEAGKISVYSSSGTLVFEKNIYPGYNQFFTKDLANGFYFVKAETKDKSEMKKFIKH
jgi:hypothetical protein